MWPNHSRNAASWFASLTPEKKEMGYKQTSEVFQIFFVCFNLSTGIYICYKFQLFLLLPDEKLFGPNQISPMNIFLR